MSNVVRLVDELHHFDCIADDIGEHLAQTLDQVSENELELMALAGEDPRCASCGGPLAPEVDSLEGEVNED